MDFISFVACTGPPISNVTVSLSSSVEEDGRQFACPGEHVTFTCEVNRSVIIRMAAEPFISRNDPASYVASSIIGNTSSGHNGTFQFILTNLQRESNQSRTANFTVTVTANTTDKTNNTVIECADQLYSDRVKRKALFQSGKTKYFISNTASKKLVDIVPLPFSILPATERVQNLLHEKLYL